MDDLVLSAIEALRDEVNALRNDLAGRLDARPLEPDEWLTAQQFAGKFPAHIDTVYGWLRDDPTFGEKWRGQWRIHRSRLQRGRR